MSLKVDQALIDSFIGADFGLPIAHENSHYEPVPETAYAQLTVFDSGKVAAALRNWDRKVGIFQVVLRCPENTGAIDAKTKAEAILAHFAVHSEHSYDDQVVTITSNSKGHGYNEDGWYKIIIRLNYTAFTPR